MIEERDIWRTANLLIERHGSDALLIAALRADTMLANGDVDGQIVWKRIVRAVEELGRRALEKGQHVH